MRKRTCDLRIKRKSIVKETRDLRNSSPIHTDKLLGRHKIRKFGPTTYEVCSYLPGNEITSVPQNFSYTLFDKWWGSKTIDGSFSPGTMKYDSMVVCSLYSLRLDQTTGENILAMISMNPPQLNAFNYSGLRVRLDVGIPGLNTLINIILAGIETKVSREINKTARNLPNSDAPLASTQLTLTRADITSGQYLSKAMTLESLAKVIKPALRQNLNEARQAALQKLSELRNSCNAAAAASNATLELGGEQFPVGNLCK